MLTSSLKNRCVERANASCRIDSAASSAKDLFSALWSVDASRLVARVFFPQGDVVVEVKEAGRLGLAALDKVSLRVDGPVLEQDGANKKV